ncbi:MAG: DUF5723 family protein [Salibacteraceae bacterium]
MRKLLLFLILAITNQVFGQNVLSLYNMKHIPQSVYANPAFIPLGRVNVSIPGLGSTYAQVGKSDFITKNVATVDDNGTLRLDVDKFLNGLENENLVYGGTSINTLHVGFSVNKNYFHLGSHDRVSGEFIFPKEMAALITEVYQENGIENGHEIQNTRVQYTHVREFSFGWARSINKDFSVGATIKVFSGLMNVRTNSSSIIINNPTPGNDLSGLIDIHMQTAGAEYYKTATENGEYIKVTSNNANLGYALDVGFDYKINSKIKVSASALDLMGTILWKNDVKNYVAEDVEVDFNTVDWVDLISPGGGSGLNGIYDSIIANVDPTQEKIEYETYTPTKVNGSFTYYLTPKIEATVLGQGLFLKDEFDPRIRIGIQGRFKRFFNYMLSYSIIDSQMDYKNLGVGFALNFGPLQLHALTDNVFDPLLYESSFNPTLRVGLNLTMNRDNQ